MDSTSLSRRGFLRFAAWGTALGFAPASLRRLLRVAPQTPPPDLVHDALPLDAFPAWFRRGVSALELTGALREEYYAVHVCLLEAEPSPRAADVGEDAESVERLLQEVNDWFAGQLCDRRLRFFYREPARIGRRPDRPDAGREAAVAELLESANLGPALGLRQQVQVLFVRGGRTNLALAAPGTVIMSLPATGDAGYGATVAGTLAHLIGHALGLGHTKTDIDTEGTEYASQNSFMDPSVAARGLAGSILLDSPLNPEKARLIASGFFPYGGRVYTGRDGAIPLRNGMVIEGNGEEIRVALGNYVLPCEARQAAVTVRGQGLTLDLGGALIRGSTDGFAAFGEHHTHGIGVLLDGGEGVTLRGGVISGYHHGVKASGLAGGAIEGVSVVNNRRLWSDASRGIDDVQRGIWLDFWETPEEDETEAWIGSLEEENLYATMGAGIAFAGCCGMTCRKVLATHNTVGITDFYGRSNRYEENDVSGCAMGIRLWQARGSRDQRLVVANNVMHFNTQPVPWWWSGGDGAAIIGAGVVACDITGNRIAFGGDGVFLAGTPRLPGQTQDVRIEGNQITHAYAHGIEVDFAGNCVIEGNTVYRSWLSGVWAGHAAGILILRNFFEANNRGRLLGGWTDSQGAISCPQGRVTVVDNMFEGNWVAVNLWAAPQPDWWLFCGDATRHIVAGNTFRDNQVGVRLWQVRRSSVTGNRMQGNGEDITGHLAENRLADNGPDVDPSGVNVVHMPVETLLFDRGQMSVDFAVSAVTARGARPIALDRLTAAYPDADAWLAVSQTAEGIVHIATNRGPDFNGIMLANLTVEAGGEMYRIPIKLMADDYIAVVGSDEPQAGAIYLLGRTPVGPAAIWGLFSPLSRILRSERTTEITGWEPFWAYFTQPHFHAPDGVSKAFVAVLADDVVELAFGKSAPSFSSPALEEDQVWEWASGVVDIGPDLGTCGVRYRHRRAGEEGVVGCVAMWLYPLDSDDLATLDALAELETSASAAGMPQFSMPGARRFFNPLSR